MRLSKKSKTLWALDNRLSVSLDTLADANGHAHVVSFLRSANAISELDDNENFISMDFSLDIQEGHLEEYAHLIRYVHTNAKTFHSRSYWAKKFKFLKQGKHVAIPATYKGNTQVIIKSMINSRTRETRYPTFRLI